MSAQPIKPIPEFRAAALEVPGGFSPAISITENGEGRVEALAGVYYDPVTAQLFAKAAVELRKHEAIRAFFATLTARFEEAKAGVANDSQHASSEP